MLLLCPAYPKKQSKFLVPLSLTHELLQCGVAIVSLIVSPWNRWHAVASWTWDAQDETCGICRMAFDGCCPDCKLPGDDCPLIWGACNHAFHLHCILKWVNSQTSQAHCPMCRREWLFKE
ncbi:Anaphase-promoting complex subunit 11 [Arabidopsis thaliana x Arabidopsis arenosa]|uniref:Anaphase-promoting complex subunit 11 n=1 Tax=Arabidopsis thaliana x Arabidopsis arenosa TaxID=1240361 RepID=A0A8T2AT58_9BRAS|nr:Anaphase-promoting complex subunit 11 [Arabidopsis thaliana x Arabidopsis arenosa]